SHSSSGTVPTVSSDLFQCLLIRTLPCHVLSESKSGTAFQPFHQVPLPFREIQGCPHLKSQSGHRGFPLLPYHGLSLQWSFHFPSAFGSNYEVTNALPHQVLLSVHPKTGDPDPVSGQVPDGAVSSVPSITDNTASLQIPECQVPSAFLHPARSDSTLQTAGPPPSPGYAPAMMPTAAEFRFSLEH